MNKLFTKIATLSVGLAMAIGVGVAVAGNKSSKSVFATDTKDTIEASDLAATNTTYTDFIGVSKPSGAVYAGNSAKSSAGGIQLRSKNSNSGIVSTISGGTVKSVKITVASGSNTLDIYGSNTAYTAATDLYNNPVGTKVGSLSATGTYTFTSNYSYVGLRSNNGAIYLTSVEITWSSGSEPTPEYIVSYDANGGSGTMSDTTNEIAECSFTAPEGKVFSVWNTAADGSGDSYAPGDNVEGDLDLFAIWVDKPICVTLDKIGTGAAEAYSEELQTVDIDDDSDTYTLNYVNGKKQNDAMILQKSSGAFISNHTEMPGVITDVVLYINSGASGNATYDVAFGTSEFTTATEGIGAVNITGGNSHSFASDVEGATYFCITLGANYNGQVLKIVVNYSAPGIDTKIWDNQDREVTAPFEMKEGQTFLFRYVDNEDNYISGASWVSSDETVATTSVKSNYTYVTGVMAGTATITVSKEGYKTATFSVVVSEDSSKETLTIYEYDGSSATNPADGSTINYSSGTGTFRYVAVNESSAIVTTTTWVSSDPTVATVTTSSGVVSVTTIKPGEFTLTASDSEYNSGTAAITVSKSWLEELSVSGSMSKTDYTTNDSWSPAGLTVEATYHSGWTEDVTSLVAWTYDPASPAEGVTSVVATATLDEISVNSAPQAVTVTVKHAGTADDPFTVAEAIQQCKDNGTTAGGPWVTKGIISKKTTWDSNFPNVTYWISDDGTGSDDTTKTVECFRGKYLAGADITSENEGEFVVGATVIVTGNLLNYKGNTPEYAANNYPLSIVPPETGDITVTFEPTTSFEIGATGTFTATADDAEATLTWSVDDASVISVDSSTGAYEALGLGVARVTVTATHGDKEGTAFADIVVNGNEYIGVGDANAIAASLPNGKTSDYYVYVEGYVVEFATSQKDGNPRALDIVNFDEDSRIMVYTNTGPYPTFVEDLHLGDYIKVKANVQNYNGTYELTNPEKVTSSLSAMSVAFELLSETDAICKDYDGVTDNKEALEAVWETLSSASWYGALTGDEQLVLQEADASESGTTIEKAMARYDYLVGKYKLDNFISGRTPVAFANQPIQTSNNSVNTNFAMIAVIVVAVTSLSAIGVLIVVKKRKYHN